MSQSPLLLLPTPSPSLSHTDKNDDNGDNTGGGVGNNVAADEVGNGKGNKGNCHLRGFCLCRHPCVRCHCSCLHCCCQYHKLPTPLPSLQPLQRLLPSPTSLTPQSNSNGVGDGDGSNGYGNKGGGQTIATMEMARSTKWQW
jgi:hypothetical protein